MADIDDETDRQQIRSLIARQFEALSWSDEKTADWSGFAADFLPSAPLLPSARPVKPTSVPDFVERMKSLAGSTLPRFEGVLLGMDIRLYGNVAVALAGCEQVQDQGLSERTVEAILLVKDEGAWHIAAQAWDKVQDNATVPDQLLD